MKHSISEAARIVDVSRKTFYKHVEKKGISLEKDANDNPVVDASELIRVYGDQYRLDRANGNKVTVEDTQDDTPVSSDVTIELAVLKKENELLKAQNTSQKDSFEEQIDYLRSKLDEATGEARKLTALLTDQRAGRSGAGDWEKSYKALEHRVANSEEAVKEAAEIKQKATRILKQNKDLKEQLEAERSKTWIHRLFG